MVGRPATVILVVSITKLMWLRAAQETEHFICRKKRHSEHLEQHDKE